MGVDKRVDAARIGGDLGIVKSKRKSSRRGCDRHLISVGIVRDERKIPGIGIGALDRHCFVLRRVKGHDPIPGKSVWPQHVTRSLGREFDRPRAISVILGARDIGID